MAVYKVIQDIEAEDKLLGPLTFKGLVYAGIAVICGFINFKLLTVTALGPFKWVLILALLFPMILFGVLASPLGREQPTEVWLLSRVRFFLKPHVRIWDQSGITELVTITVPKKVMRQLTKSFSQGEVTSRLQALATTLDSRGWAVKNINVNLNAEPNYFSAQDESDRLIAAENMAMEVPEIDVHAADDMLDEQSNPTAQNFQNMIVQAEEARRQQMAERLNQARLAAETAAAKAAAEAAKRPPKSLIPEPEQIERLQEIHPHEEKIHDLRPIYEIHRSAKSGLIHDLKSGSPNRVTAEGQTDKLELAQSGNDLSVASIASLANRNPRGEAASAAS
ncbi:MAG: hypothetical protein JWO96_98 [Candidatus Saccharibacteria bacterium]|nr:hypothetical protein [Candidatus Saccharibacteria bacterium]